MGYAFGDYVLSLRTLELCREGEPVPMEPQVFAVLVYLLEHRDRVVTKEELLDNVWGDRFVSESALSSRVKAARRAVGDDGRTQAVIRTVHGRGYRVVATVTEVAETETAPDPAPAVPTSPARTSEVTLAIDREFPFVGRDDTLSLAADLATAPGTTALLVGGEPGIGKSRVGAEIANRLAHDHGFVALGGRCERHLATSLQPWLEALTPYVEGAPIAELTHDTAGIVDQLRPVLPAIDGRLGSTDVAPHATLDEFVAIDALVTLIERISARRRLVILLDDVQWSGGPTRALASLLVRRGVADALAILTFRTTIDDLDESADEWLRGLVAAGAVRHDLAGLGHDDVRVLVSSVLAGDVADAGDLGDEVFSRSEGHSLFAVELIRDLRTGHERGALPDSVATLVRSRLARLPRGVASLVVAGAALGQEFDLTLAADTAGLADDDALDAVEVAMAAELLHEVPDRPDWYRFSHQLVPAAALDSVSTSRRVRLHARLADLLDDREASGIEVAHHLLEASPVLDARQVVERVMTTSAAALRDHQYDRAVELLERAARLDVAPRTRAEVLARFGEACNLAGQQPRALEPLEQLAAMARSHGWDDLLAAAALGRWGQSPFRASRDRTVIPLLDEAIGRSASLDRDTRARLLAKRAAFNLFSGPMEERDRLSAEAVEMVGAGVSYARLEVLEARWMAIASPARLDEVVALDDELAVLRKSLGALTTDACAPEISVYWRALGDELHRLADELANDPRQRRDVDQWRTTALTGAFALFRCDLDEARRCADWALPLSRAPWGEAGQVVHGLVHLLADVLGGGPSTATDRWSRIAASVPSDAMRSTRAWAEAMWGDREVAAELGAPVVTRVGLLTENFMGGFGLVALAETALLLDRDDWYPQLIDALTPLSGQMLGHPWAPSLAAADPLARIHLRRGEEREGESCAARAMACYEGLGAESLAVRLRQLTSVAI